MDIKRNASQPSAKGPVEWFTGIVRIDPLFEPTDPARTGGAYVTFEPGGLALEQHGALASKHTHPLRQILVMTAGCGRVQQWGGPIEQVRPGDVVRFAPGEKHWHGAAPTTAMTHIAVHEYLDGKVVGWLGHVSDDQYHIVIKSK